MFDKDFFLEVIKHVELILITFIPIVIYSYKKIKSEIMKELVKLNKQDKSKLEAEYQSWKHKKTLEILFNLQNICDFYRDVSLSDQVYFLQITNGTTAYSNISNLYVTCEAEDSRYGPFAKVKNKVLKIQCSLFLPLIDSLLKKNPNIFSQIDLKGLMLNDDIFENVKNTINVLIKNNDNIIGFGIMNYTKVLDISEINKEIELSKKFEGSLENVFLEFNIDCEKKRKELNLD